MSDRIDELVAGREMPEHIAEFLCSECPSTCCEGDDWRTCATLLAIGRLLEDGTAPCTALATIAREAEAMCEWLAYRCVAEDRRFGEDLESAKERILDAAREAVIHTADS